VLGGLRKRRAAVLCLLGLTLLSFIQRPGRVTFDTKLDLAVDPMGFMQRSLHLWNPQATSGELQNQAYGYLVPMGPFFAAGQALGVPMWVTQRLWCALLLCLAFGGALLLARAMRIGTEPARHVGALAYALAPRMLTEIGTLSSEMLPAVLLPWVLLPLVRPERFRTPRRAAAVSGLAVLGMGGVNASVVVMALVLPALWLATRRFTRAHLTLAVWWCVAVAGCVLWWLLPLLLLGRYSLPFLTYIESAANTTGVVSMFQAVRGTNQWIAYVVEGVPWWPAGWMLVDNPVLMVATMLVAALGLAGLAARGLPERRFLVLAMLSGLLLITVGFVGALDSPLSERARDLLDGRLAPFRNVHKFEPVLRLPVALGLIHALSLTLPLSAVRRLIRTARRRGGWALVALRGETAGRAAGTGWLLAAPALLLVLVMAAPAWLIALRPGPGWSDLPGYWRDAATWLARQDPAARTLLVPGSGFGQYTWGRTIDEPIQALAGAPWSVRSQIPLGSEGNTRVMDTVEEVLASGAGSPGLAAYLARNGYRYLLLRNDLDRTRPDVPPIAVLRQSLARSAGVRLAATFGPRRGPPPDGRSPVDDIEQPAPTIEVYEVDRSVARVRTVLAADVPVVSGGPESTLPLLEQGLLGADRPALLAGDRDPGSGGAVGGGAAGTAGGASGGPQWLVTDGLRRRERNVGRVRENVSHTLTADEAPRQNRAALDLLPFTGTEHQTVAVYRGVRSVAASTAVSYADVLGDIEPSGLPYAGIDNDPRTAWHSASLVGPRGQWFEVVLDTPRQVNEVRLQFVNDIRVGWPVTRFRLTTDGGSADHDVTPGAVGAYPVPGGGLVTRVRVTVLAVSGDRNTGNVGIRELTVEGMAASRALRVPTDQETTGPPAYAFSRGYQSRPSCFPADGALRCDPTLARGGEEPHGLDRLFRTPVAARYGLRVTAVAAPGGAPPLPPAFLEVDASSWLAGDPQVGPLAAIDRDPATAWLADIGDPRPALKLRWLDKRPLDRIEVRFAGRPIASRPIVVELVTPAGNRTVRLGPDGTATFPELVTDSVDVVIDTAQARLLDRRGATAEATAGFAEVMFPPLAQMRPAIPASTPFSVPCGSGPVVELDGVRFDTSVSGTLAEYNSGQPMPVTICDLFAADALDLPPGEHRLRTAPSRSFLIQDATLRPLPATPASGGPALSPTATPDASAPRRSSAGTRPVGSCASRPATRPSW
jgi:arabinofuranan 3-O-arabinosyltransferase